MLDERVPLALARGDKVAARRLYQQAAAAHRWSAGLARAAIVFVYLSLLGLFGVGGITGCLDSYRTRTTLGERESGVRYRSERRALDSAEVIADIGIVRSLVDVVAAVALLVVTARSRRRFARRLDAQACEEASPTTLPRLRKLISDLAAEMDIQNRFTLLVPTRTRGIAPSVHMSGSRVDLVVPPRLAVLSIRRPRVAAAMLAHELAHVAQNDSGFWLLAVALATSIKRVLSPLLWLSAIGGLALLVILLASGIEGSAVIAIAMLGVVVPVLALLTIRWVMRLRLRSEHLADLAAMIYVDPTALREAADMLIDMAASDPWHEAPSMRAFRAKLLEQELSATPRSA